ncbi:MAG: hypothetical protein K2J00_03540 [Bacteroidaceae bacterium]|nr:hypothetical protein [Bacteroidaceae bacterium]
MASLFQRLVIRYGVFLLLILMSIGILFFICSFELRTKCSIRLFYDRHDSSWYGYIANRENVGIRLQDTLQVVQTSMGDVSYIVESIALEPDMLRIKLSPVRKDTFPDTFSEGFLYVGKERIIDKIRNRSLR